jgi:hypothetical protein
VFRASGYCFLGLLGLALLAFWPEYLSRLPGGGISRYVHLHAIAMTLWLALLIAQPFLLRAGRRSLHRRLGKLSYGLAPIAIVAGVLLAHAALVRDAATDAAGAGTTLYLPLSMIAWFAVCYGLAIATRKTPARHARFMIGTSLALIDPIAVRVVVFYLAAFDHPVRYQLISWGLAAAVLVLLMWFERGQSRGRAVFPAMLGAITVVWGLWFTVAQSPAWLDFARWFHDLPLT